MKKVLSFLLVVTMVFCFVACSKKSTTSETSSAAAAPVEEVKVEDEPVTITFWHCASDDAGTLMDKYIKEFNETNEHKITVNAIYQGQYSDATTLLKTIISAENWSELPDVMQLDATGKVSYYDSGKAFTVDDAIKAYNDDITSEYLEGPLGNWQFAGTQLGLPFASSTTVTFYNKDLLAKAGWDHCPDTFAEVSQLAADMKKAGLTQAAYAAVPNSPTLANWLGQLGSYVVNNSNGADSYATELACIDNGALKTFLTEWKKMYDNGGVLAASYSTNQFIAGEVAIFTSSTSNVNTLLAKINGAFELGTSTYLRVNSSADYGATVSGSCVVMFNSENNAKKKAAWEFVKYLTGKDVQTDFAVGTGYIPGCKAALETEEYQNLLKEVPQYATGGEQLEKTPASMRSITVGPTVDFYYAIQNEILAMLNENKTPDAALASMKDDLQGLLDNWVRTNL